MDCEVGAEQDPEGLGLSNQDRAESRGCCGVGRSRVWTKCLVSSGRLNGRAECPDMSARKAPSECQLSPLLFFSQAPAPA